ncbi:MAG: efflux RND transporter permease subunit [Gammaproteobacteria bacterium]|nr:efflux RND transporter permease subunit [Gammaproteobacteria bacterium]NNF61956.1 efflux RND transporter permease subunit [Gammaproteobacteria bacterium]NNM21170.1 efflux RND transporter permease subunit [Gammaproteobacteria bacterium]
MRHTALALRRPIGTVMVFLALGVVGLIGSQLLPLEEFPDIEFPGIFVQIPYPGATAEEVETMITRPVEEALATLSGIERIQSQTSEGQAQIFVQFGWNKEVSAKGIEARAKVDAIRGDLPADIRRIFIFTGSLGDQPILVLRISSDSRNLEDSYDMLDRLLKRRIERIEGVSRVELQGVMPREIRILLDANRIAAHGLDVRVVREQLERSNFAVSAGRITDAGQRFSIRPRGEFQSLEEIRDLVIGSQGLRLRDIADVSLHTPERNFGRHLDQQYAIGISVFKTTGANMVEVADRVMEEVEKARTLPQMRGVNIFTLDNKADGVRSSLSDLLRSGLIGAVLAIIVLYAFLRHWTTTLIVTLSVPFSLLISLAVMYFSGLSLNILSMMGLMLGVGMLVDNAVVVTESIFRYRQMYPDEPHKATLMGVREVGVAVIAGTATSIIVFVPVMFGTKTDITVFLTHVAVTISVAMLASLVIAQTLVPMLAARVPSPPVPRTGSLMARLSHGYADLLDWTLHHRWWTLLGIVLIVASGSAVIGLSIAFPGKLVEFETFPQAAARRLFLPFHIENQHPLDEVEKAVYKVEGFLYDNREKLDIVAVYSYFEPGRAESTILLTEREDATISTEDVIEFVEENLPEIIIGKPSFDFDQEGGGEGFSLQISGDSTEQLAVIAQDVTRILRSVDGLEGIRADMANGENEVQVIVDRERASRVGLTAGEVATSVGIAMRGDNLREFRGAEGEVDVRLAFRENDRQTIEDLANLPLWSGAGERITLGSVASFHVTRGARQITRVDRQTAVIINANLDDTTMDEVRPEIKSLMEEFELPPGYSWKFGRGFDRNDETQQIMAVNILLGIMLIFIVMAALFESSLYPISIVTSIALSIFGVFWFFLITGTTFSFMASIGIMILIGVVVNNGIVLIDHINNLRREGHTRHEAILQGARDRLRPILMTVATTILGLMPLAVGNTQIGGGGPPYYPMARAIIGGLAFSTITSLLVVPTVYVWFDGLARWWRKVLSTARGTSGSTPAAIK